MPTYQYACTACDHAFEQVQSFHEDSLSECPQCEGRLRKIFNAVGVVFKGSGFYRTDSRSDSRSESHRGATTTSSESSTTQAKASSDTSTSSSSDSGSSATGSTSTAGAA